MEAVLLVGVPGAGKSTFYRQRFADTHVRINLDTLKTRSREWAAVQTCLANNQPFVVDNTNVNYGERARYIQAAQAAGFQLSGYYFDVLLEEAMRRNRQRIGKALVPEMGLLARYRALQPPAWAEGFDRLFVIRVIEEGGDFQVTELERGVELVKR